MKNKAQFIDVNLIPMMLLLTIHPIESHDNVHLGKREFHSIRHRFLRLVLNVLENRDDRNSQIPSCLSTPETDFSLHMACSHVADQMNIQRHFRGTAPTILVCFEFRQATSNLFCPGQCIVFRKKRPFSLYILSLENHN